MKKRIVQRLLIIIGLVLLTGCVSIRARVSSCQRMLANTFSASNRIPRQEHLALLVFDEATHGGIAPAATGIFPCKSVPPPCQWAGITCTSGHVTRINLDNSSLTGEIPAELGDLSELWVLSLAYNQFSGEIPPELGNLAQLELLNLTNNQLSGQIPAELGNLSELKWLWLGHNRLSGEIPAELGYLYQLNTLNLANNQLSGEIPSGLGNLPQLQRLYLNGNRLGGEIPPELGSLAQLWELHLNDNPLSGPLPGGMTEQSLNTFYLSDTELCIPQTAEFEAWIAGLAAFVANDVPYCE
jgi:Leucine-rich repeat (LRR) protein